MSKDTKYFVDNIGLDSLSMKHVRGDVTCLSDLPDEIFLLICRYLSPANILHSFYTPSTPELRLHRIIFDYYTNIKFDGIRNAEYIYLIDLFFDSKTGLRPESLILSNKHITHLTRRYFEHITTDVNQSMFTNLRRLTLIDCCANDLTYINEYIRNLTQLEYVYITVGKSDKDPDIYRAQTCNVSFTNLLFNGEMSSIHTVYYEINDGLVLRKSLRSHQNLRNINLVLQTIDDLYILLDGLVPNVQTMIIRLCQPRILSRRLPKSNPSCLRLTQFTLLESRIGLFIDDMESIFGYMPNIIKLILSVRDTPDPIFCHGPVFESILNEHLPHLRQFDYTMTHRINDQTVIKDFVRRAMNVTFYDSENSKWVHIYSLPWPSNKDDKRQLPIVNDGSNPSVTSDVKRVEYVKDVIITEDDEFILLNTQFCHACQIRTCLSLDIKLPSRISKVILSEGTDIFSINSVIQPSVHHLIVKRRLYNEIEILILARQFPYLKYLELLLPLNKCSFIECLNIVFNRDDNIDKRKCYWSELIIFSTELVYEGSNIIRNGSEFYDWCIRNTDLKYYKYLFHIQCSSRILTIWF